MPARHFVAALSAFFALAAPAAAQETIRLTVAAGHPPIFLWVKHLHETFIPTVDAELQKTGRYKVQWNEAYGGTLTKMGSELETMQQGISDLGIVATVFHSSKMPLNNVTYFVPFGPTQAERVVQAIDYVQTLPELSGEWKKHNVVYLAGFTLDSYGIAAKVPLGRVEDFKGRKIGGAGPNLNWIKNTGAVGVQGSLNSFYNDIKSGVYDGAFVFMTAAVPAKLYEVAPHFTVVNRGAMYAGAVAINKSRWDKFPPEVRAAFQKGAAAYKDAYIKEQTARIAAATEAWKKNGGKIAVLAPAEQARLVKAIPNPTEEWIKQAGPAAKKVLAAYMDAVRAGGFKFQRDFDKE